MNSTQKQGFFLVLIMALAIGIFCMPVAAADEPIIIDHTSTHLEKVPLTAIENAKSLLHIAYGHTSHGSQITDGMTGLVTFTGAPYGGSRYRWNSGGSGGALDLRDSPFTGASDLGNPSYTAWAAATRTYLNAHPEINVVMWSWCGQADTTEDNINTYLSLMNQLEQDYPDVKFVYMTGHLVGSGENGRLNQRNEQIRAYVRAHNKILYDFADIESYDPDGFVNYMKLRANDNCDYDSDNNGNLDKNWATIWQGSHMQGVDWYNCGAAHTKPLNANQKAYAAWWLWARLAGWDGTSAQANPVPSLTGISPGSVTAGDPAFTLIVDGSDFIPGSIVQVGGSSRTTTYISPFRLEAAIPASDIAAEGTVDISVFNPAPGGGSSTGASLVIVHPAPVTGSVEITSAPAGAAIILDGAETGKTTPATIADLSPGDHLLAVSLAGYKTGSMTVNIVEGETVSASFTLDADPAPVTGSVEVTSAPAGAAISLDGAETGKITPATIADLSPGDHLLAVSLAGYKTGSMTVNIVEGETVSASFPLTADPDRPVPEFPALALPVAMIIGFAGIVHQFRRNG